MHSPSVLVPNAPCGPAPVILSTQISPGGCSTGLGEANWVVVLLLFAAIPLLAVGKRKGWWLAITGSIAILMINIPTQFIRTKTLDYLYGALLAAGVLIFTMVPYFKKHLLADENVAE